MNDLPKLVYNKSIPALFADDTSILFMHSNATKFIANIHTVFGIINTWFKTVIFNTILKNLIIFTLRLGTGHLMT